MSRMYKCPICNKEYNELSKMYECAVACEKKEKENKEAQTKVAEELDKKIINLYKSLYELIRQYNKISNTPYSITLRQGPSKEQPSDSKVKLNYSNESNKKTGDSLEDLFVEYLDWLRKGF